MKIISLLTRKQYIYSCKIVHYALHLPTEQLQLSIQATTNVTSSILSILSKVTSTTTHIIYSKTFDISNTATPHSICTSMHIYTLPAVQAGGREFFALPPRKSSPLLLSLSLGARSVWFAWVMRSRAVLVSINRTSAGMLRSCDVFLDSSPRGVLAVHEEESFISASI